MQVIVKLKPQPALAQAATQSLEEVPAALHAAAAPFGVQPRPLHPGTADATLRSYFCLDAPDPETARKLAQRLAQLPEVDGAYVKPPDALP